MALTFPKDEELFLDLDTIRVERVTAEMDQVFHVYGDEKTFGKEFRDILADWYKYRYSFSVRNEANKLWAGFETLLNSVTREYHEKLEQLADRYADGQKIGSFPRSFMKELGLEGKEYASMTEERDYFKELDKVTSFMKGMGRVGDFLAKAKAQLDIIANRGRFLCMLVWMLVVGAAVVLASAEAIAFLPGFLADLVENNMEARIIVCGSSVLSAGLLLLLDPIVQKEEKGKYLIKAFSNKVFLFAVAAGAFLLNLRVLFFQGPTGPYNPYFLLPFGIFYLLYAVIILLNRWISVRRAKKALCALVDENIQHMHRYLRFHCLWWEAQNPGKEHCYSLQNLQKSFDYLVRTYHKFK